MKVTLREIYIQFLILGIQLLGGGYVIVPLMKRAFIENRQWITEEELTDYYAVSQSIPGIIAANISIFVGYKIRGKAGATAAILGIITSPIICIILIALILDKLLQFPFIQSIFWGVGVAVIILLYLSVKEIWKNSVNDIFSSVIFLATLFLSLYCKISPAKIIVLSLIVGVSYKYLQKKRSEK